LSKITPNFAHFGPQNFLGKRVPFSKCWDLYHKLQATFDYVAKFHGDCPRELEKKTRISAVKYKTAKNYNCF